MRILCSRHKKIIDFVPRLIVDKEGRKELLYCPRCHRVVPASPHLAKLLTEASQREKKNRQEEFVIIPVNFQ